MNRTSIWLFVVIVGSAVGVAIGMQIANSAL
jgi:hypothetical protein